MPACVRLALDYWIWHGTPVPPHFDGDVKAYEKEAWKKAQILPVVEDACMSTQFSHIFPEVILPDITAINGRKFWMQMLSHCLNKRNLQSGVTASFRENILSKGGTEHPMTLYKRFRG